MPKMVRRCFNIHPYQAAMLQLAAAAKRIGEAEVVRLGIDLACQKIIGEQAVDHQARVERKAEAADRRREREGSSDGRPEEGQG